MNQRTTTEIVHQELTQRIVELRQELIRSREEIRTLRHAQLVIDAMQNTIPLYRTMLAEITWAETLEGAKGIAERALREEWDDPEKVKRRIARQLEGEEDEAV